MATYFTTVSAMVSSGIGQVRAVTTSAAERVVTRIAGVLSVAQDAKVAGMSHVATIRGLAMATAESMQKKGLRTWSTEVARALRAASGAQATLMKATAYKVLADAGEKTRQGASVAHGKVLEVSKATTVLVSQKSFQATAGSAVGGAVAMGTGGGATGLAAGGAIGAIAGLPLAFFTFGLSVPLGAAIGGGTGLVAGAAAGATAGAVGGGAVGYGAYTKKDEIAGAAKYVQRKASEGTSFVQCKASDGASFVKCKANEGANQVKGVACKSVEYTRGVAAAAKARVVSKAELQKLKAN